MKKNRKLITRFKTAPMVVLAVVFLVCLWGCPPRRSSTCPEFVQPSGDFGYAANQIVQANVFDRVSLGVGDHCTLVFPCEVSVMPLGPSNIVVVPDPRDRHKFVITLSSAISNPVSIGFFDPVYNLTISSGSVVVWPGDANADGKRNMDDLMPIAKCIRNHVTISNPAIPILYPPSLPQLNRHYLREPFGSLIPDPIHADCNLDGRIDLEDVEYLMAVLNPVLPGELRRDRVGGRLLGATLADDMPMRAVIIGNDSFGLQLSFAIDILSSPTSVFGLLFTRSVDDAERHRVDTTKFAFQESQVFRSSAIMVARQKFWHNIRYESGSSTGTNDPCTLAAQKPLDVGMFNVSEDLLDPIVGDRIGHCLITLIDVFRSGAEPFVFNQNLLNIVFYRINPNGEVEAYAVECRPDSVMIKPRSLCNPTQLIIRDGYDDEGIAPAPAHPFANDSIAWISPDVWIRHSRDDGAKHQEPRLGEPEYVYARVFNKGCDTLRNVKVFIYSTLAKSDIKWPIDFEGGEGQVVASGVIPEILPWSSATFSQRWIVPSRASLLPGATYPGTPVLSFFAMALLGGTAPSFHGRDFIHDQLLGLGDVAMRSSMRLTDDVGTSSGNGIVMLRNLSDAGVNVTLRLEQVDGSEFHPASNFGSLILIDFQNALRGGVLQEMTAPTRPAPSPPVFTLNSRALKGSISNIALRPNEIHPIAIRFNLRRPNPGGPLHYRYRLYTIVDSHVMNSTIFEFTVPGP